MLKSVLGAATFALVLFASSSGEAQLSRTGRPIQRFDRWLGVGPGHGYHWKNPGPDSRYYNPWSEHNSRLVAPGWDGNPQGFLPAVQPPSAAPPAAASAPAGQSPADSGRQHPGTRSHVPGPVPTPAVRAAQMPGQSPAQQPLQNRAVTDYLKLEKLDSGW